MLGDSSFSSKTGVLGLVPAVRVTLDSPEAPWKSPLLGLVSLEAEETFPNRDLAGSGGGFPNSGAAEPNILEPEAPGSTVLLLGANNPEDKK